jgi:hypothetical protein
VCSAVSEEGDCNSCATCISHTISHGTTQPSIHLRLVQEIRAERVHLQKQVSLVGPLCLMQLWTVFGLVSNAVQTTPCDFFLWDYIKKVFVSPLPRSLPELRQRIITAIASITRGTLYKIRDELDYPYDICSVTRLAHIESL